MKKFKELFKNKNKRYITMLILFIPIIIAMIFFGMNIFKEYKNVKFLISDSSDVSNVVVSNDHKIESMNYVLRDNETEYQMEIFTELKKAVENNELAQKDVAGLVVKNFVADFFTWSNKVGQYDVGGLYYVPSYSRENIYTSARDGFYKYFNEYMDKYGVENLLEVENVEITSSTNAGKYDFSQTVKYYNLEDDWDFNEYTRVDVHTYDSFDVTATWSYKDNSIFVTTKYPTSCKFKVVYNNEANRYEIVVMGDTLTSDKGVN